MKFLYIIIILFISITCATASAADATSSDLPSHEAEELAKQCNLEARNALIHENLKLVEDICMKAVKEIEKSSTNKKYLINPILNLAFSFTLASQFDKADPLYKKALGIGEKIYEPGSREIKKINDVIRQHEEMKRHYGR